VSACEASGSKRGSSLRAALYARIDPGAEEDNATPSGAARAWSVVERSDVAACGGLLLHVFESMFLPLRNEGINGLA
jgi:hypothetical protein